LREFKYIFMSSLIQYITFPGVIFHELGHVIFCKLAKVKIYRISYFKFGATLGFVEHEAPQKLHQSFFISIGPLILNSIICLIFTAIFFRTLFVSVSHVDLLILVFWWIGFSAGVHAFPSVDDIENFKNSVYERSRWSLFRIISLPFVYIFSLVKKFEYIEARLIYASTLGIVLPFFFYFFQK